MVVILRELSCQILVHKVITWQLGNFEIRKLTELPQARSSIQHQVSNCCTFCNSLQTAMESVWTGLCQLCTSGSFPHFSLENCLYSLQLQGHLFWAGLRSQLWPVYSRKSVDLLFVFFVVPQNSERNMHISLWETATLWTLSWAWWFDVIWYKFLESYCNAERVAA